MRSAYRSVLRRGDVLSALVPYVLARLPLTMAPLALLLMSQQKTGSYHWAGLVCGAYAVSVAVAAPVLGRLVDRHGQARVLLGAGFVHAGAMVSAAVAAGAGQRVLVLLAAVVAGMSLPPVTACMRVLWTRLLPDEDSRQAGFAIDGVIVEIAELGGPLLVSLMLVLGRPTVAVGVSGVVMGVAAVAFRSTRASREVPVAGVTRNPWGALVVPGVRRLLGVVALSTASIGAVEVAVTAFARHHGGMSTAGVYIGVISAGGIVAGVVFGGSGRIGRQHPIVVLATTLLVSASSAVLMAEWAEPVAVVLILFLFGAAVAVGVIVQLATMSAIVDDSCRTEAFTWGATANFVGLGLGTAAAGWTIDRNGLAAAFFVAAVPTAVAALLTIASRSALTTTAPAAEGAVEQAPTTETVAAPVLTPTAEIDPVAEELAELRSHIRDLETALAAALDSPGLVVADARDRARRMLDRADAACLEVRERADDDANRVRAAATTAALEIMAAAERDARAILDRARREADAVTALTRRAVEAVEGVEGAQPTRPMLHALPALDERHEGPTDGNGVAATS
jgi:MFS family permease